ncbi:MAG: hypothetical protein C4326_11150 [Ignavibacteria bacterium]
MRRVCILISFASVVCGCGTTSDTDRRWLQLPPDTVAQAPQPDFETRTDTIAVHTTADISPRAAASPADTVRFSVQIGAFRNRRFAGAAQSKARARFELPVISDYIPARRLYHLRVGFFETREQAEAFRAKIIQHYPNEYGDAWVVRIAQK